MARLQLDVITAERVVFSDEVDMVVAPGMEGELGLLPNHAAILTTLAPGRMLIRKGGEETELAITGGFLELSSNRVNVLADAAERAEEIDLERAEAARKRAEERLRGGAGLPGGVDQARADAALRRSLARIRVAQRRRRPQGPPTA